VKQEPGTLVPKRIKRLAVIELDNADIGERTKTNDGEIGLRGGNHDVAVGPARRKDCRGLIAGDRFSQTQKGRAGDSKPDNNRRSDLSQSMTVLAHTFLP
jgi:hypothetical protein